MMSRNTRVRYSQEGASEQWEATQDTCSMLQNCTVQLCFALALCSSPMRGLVVQYCFLFLQYTTATVFIVQCFFRAFCTRVKHQHPECTRVQFGAETESAFAGIVISLRRPSFTCTGQSNHEERTSKLWDICRSFLPSRPVEHAQKQILTD